MRRHLVIWGKLTFILIAGGSLGYLLAEPTSRFFTLPLIGIAAGAAWLLHMHARLPSLSQSQLEQEKRLIERRYRSLVQATAAIVWQTSAAGEFDTPQPEWSAFTGQPFEDLAGWGWIKAIHPDDRDRVALAWTTALAKRALYQCEARLRTCDGEFRDVATRAVPVFADDGRLLEWLGVCTDITDRRRAEKVFAESERHLHRVLDSLFAFVGVLTPNGIMVSTNAAPLRAAGLSPEDVMGRPFWDCYWWSWSPAVQEQLKRTIAKAAQGESSRYDVEIRMAGGQLMTIDFMLAPMRDNDGVITHLVPSGVDVSDRKQAEAAVAQREQFYRQLIEGMPLLTWTCLPNGTCDYICTRWEQFAGASADPAASFISMEHVHPDEREAVAQAWRNSIAAGQPFQAEMRLRRHDGAYRWFASYATPLRDHRGEIVNWFGTTMEINDRKQMEEALRESESRLRGANASLEKRVKERTAEVVARSDQLRALALDLAETEARERKRLAQLLHDHFQQLLSAAKLKAGVLRRRLQNDEAAHDGLRQVESILDEAIEASRSVATQLSPPVLHDAGLVAALEWLRRRMESDHQLKVHIKVDGGCEPENEQVRMILFECVREVLFNVRKHAGVDFAEMVLEALPEGVLRVQVIDQGKGFDAMKLSRRTASDTSFGLFSIRERLSLIGGLMAVESQPGKGTRVTLSVPCAVSRAVKRDTPASPGTAAGVSPGARRLRVMVADDHAAFREGLVAMLVQEPYIEIVGQAADGAEALELARRLRPDVMIVDVSMPKLNGVQVTSAVSSELPRTHIVGLSMHEHEDMAKAMRDAGAAMYCAKSGVAEDTLLAFLRSAAKQFTA